MSGLMDLLHHVSEDVLLRILSSFTAATGLNAIIVDRDGRTLLPANSEKDCTFCRIIKGDPVGCNKCRGSYARAGLQAAQFGEPYIFRCHAGLVAFAAPIVIEGTLLGSIICGQVLMWEPEDFFWEEISEMTAGLNVKQGELIKAAGELEVLSGRKVQAAADLLFVVANHVMQSSNVAVQQRKEIARRQAQLNDEIRQRKELEQKLVEVEGRIYGHSMLQKEKELMAAVRLGDKENAMNLLNWLVSDLVEKFVAKPRVFKVRILELMVTISRAAAEAGADPDKLLDLNYRYLDEFSRNERVDELSNWIFKALDSIMEIIYGNVNLKHLEVIERATEFIRKNYDRNLSLNDIAQACFISSYHLSHIFKEQLNCTIMEYLTRVRMEEAKKMLSNPRFTIIDIAEKIGYNDPGYFCRVFKKKEGITPSAYKKQLM